MVFVYTVSAILLVLLIKGIIDRITLKKKTIEFIRRTYGEVPAKTYSESKKKSLQAYYLSRKTETSVDDITWNDLNMDQVFMTMNSAKSAMGEEFLYSLLRCPVFDNEELNEREKLIDRFMKDDALREELELIFCSIGTMKTISVYEYVNRLQDAKRESNFKHFIQMLLLFACLAYIVIDPVIGIIALIVMFAVNVITYYKRKSEIEAYFSVVAYIIRMLDAVKDLDKIKDETVRPYIDIAVNAASKLKSLRFGATLIVPKDNNGDILQSLLDFVRIAIHIDLIRFNSMLKVFDSHSRDFCIMFEAMGCLDAMIAVASFRNLMQEWCLPELTEIKAGEKYFIEADNIYHPMIDEPVKNSIKTDRSCLITGSNASGKSTFIKTVAINAILAQSVHTCMADSYRASFFRVLSSMALQDNLKENESYYIVEIKSLKRIMDASEGPIPVLCFIDEVLRGTNTLERIAASSRILQTLGKRSICFAATHDIELTFILEQLFTNYHFEEHVEDNNVLFDYTLREGRAVTRNAIKLLGMLGYKPEIIEAATEMANSYLETGEWKCLK